ncbi:hypothetical protein [Streptomyces sp. NPDC058613]|uniref:hypothetical protein n=1 Tax=Streptomyces sp. NPDC058613 TaxID=3346556 RepID=UPI0036603301
MFAFTGLGFVPMAFFAVIAFAFFRVNDSSEADWRSASLLACFVTLVLGAVNLLLAAGVNRSHDRRRPTAAWNAQHRANGLSLQSHTPGFLTLAAVFLVLWSAQRLSWAAAGTGFALLVALYVLPAGLLHRAERADVNAQRQKIAQQHGWQFAARGSRRLAKRWRPIPSLSVSEAERVNEVPATESRPYAVLSGRLGDRNFTVADMSCKDNNSVMPAWNRRRTTLYSVHLDQSLLFLDVRITPRRWGSPEVAADTVAPDFARLILTPAVVQASVEAGLQAWSLKGSDLIVRVEHTRGDLVDDSAEGILEAIERIGSVLDHFPADFGAWSLGGPAEHPLRGRYVS